MGSLRGHPEALGVGTALFSSAFARISHVLGKPLKSFGKYHLQVGLKVLKYVVSVIYEKNVVYTKLTNDEPSVLRR